MQVRAEGRTDQGLVRKNNEDAFLVNEDLGLFAVADGMGGELAGEIASRMTLDVLRDYLARVAAGEEALIGAADDRFSASANLLASGIRLANRVVFEAALSNPGWRRMGSTIAAVRINEDRLACAHVGDSRIYLLRGGALTQLTGDHSLVAEQVRRGLISSEEAENSSLRNIITRAVGQAAEVEVDLRELEFKSGDRVLICSDGLTTMVNNAAICAIIAGEADPATACNLLIAQANEAGGRDNITLVLLHLMADGFLSGVQRFFRRAG